MILGSHNSWSYLPVRKWWMRPIAWIARCQNIDVRKQYELGVRCFDLRIRMCDRICFVRAHGIVEYKAKDSSLFEDLIFLNDKGDCHVRVIHEVRNKNQYTGLSILDFRYMCKFLQDYFDKIHFFCGRNLYNLQVDYNFGEEPTCDEAHVSVSKHRWLYGCWPWLYARLHNKTVRVKEADKEILLIDYVNI